MSKIGTLSVLVEAENLLMTFSGENEIFFSIYDFRGPCGADACIDDGVRIDTQCLHFSEDAVPVRNGITLLPRIESNDLLEVTV